MKLDLKSFNQKLGFFLLSASFVLVLLIIVIISFNIISNGYSVINLSFLTENPRNGMMSGGIFPSIVGTFFVTVITAVFSVPVGMACAIYLNEYAEQNLFTRIVRVSIRNLAGVPSIVYGLFGVVLFVQMIVWGHVSCLRA